jgi:hypothetical protein
MTSNCNIRRPRAPPSSIFTTFSAHQGYLTGPRFRKCYLFNQYFNLLQSSIYRLYFFPVWHCTAQISSHDLLSSLPKYIMESFIALTAYVLVAYAAFGGAQLSCWPGPEETLSNTCWYDITCAPVGAIASGYIFPPDSTPASNCAAAAYTC